MCNATLTMRNSTLKNKQLILKSNLKHKIRNKCLQLKSRKQSSLKNAELSPFAIITTAIIMGSWLKHSRATLNCSRIRVYMIIDRNTFIIGRIRRIRCIMMIYFQLMLRRTSIHFISRSNPTQ